MTIFVLVVPSDLLFNEIYHILLPKMIPVLVRFNRRKHISIADGIHTRPFGVLPGSVTLQYIQIIAVVVMVIWHSRDVLGGKILKLNLLTSVQFNLSMFLCEVLWFYLVHSYFHLLHLLHHMCLFTFPFLLFCSFVFLSPSVLFITNQVVPLWVNSWGSYPFVSH